ncbi:MAG: hypothetical protein R2847_12660 [Bacteroidia bacterium]
MHTPLNIYCYAKKIYVQQYCCSYFTGAHGQNKLTPETLWKLGRVGETALSPDGKQ